MTKRDGLALWRALKEQELEDDFEEIMAMSDEELDKEINDNGGDAAAIRARGAKHGADLIAARNKRGWGEDRAADEAAYRALVESIRAKLRPLSRDELLARVRAAKSDPRFPAPVAAYFHKKTPEACTDDELRGMLERIEVLAAPEPKKG